MKQEYSKYSNEQLKNIIDNYRGWLEECERKIKDYEAWGSSWANSSFAFDAAASRIRWERKLKDAEAELARRKNI